MARMHEILGVEPGERKETAMTKCDICDKLFKSGDRDRTVGLCSPACADAFHLMVYLNRLEERREKDEASNLRTYREARELSAWLAVYRFGNRERKKEATKVIRAFVR